MKLKRTKPCIQQVMSLVRSSRWHEIKTINDRHINTKELQLFYNVRDELVCHMDNILLRNNLTVVPSALRRQAIEIAHEGHQGINRTKSFIRSKIWFPRVGEQVGNTIKSCIACQAATYANTSSMEPLKMSAMPEKEGDFFLRRIPFCYHWRTLTIPSCRDCQIGLSYYCDSNPRSHNSDALKS